MFRSIWLSLLLLPLVASAATPGAAYTPTTVRRFALLVGVNDGGPGRAKLRYAVTDAQSFGKVLEELGGVQPQDQLVLLETDRAGLEGALARFIALIKSAKAPGRTEAIIYYSGHSDEEGLLLQNDRYGYRELRRALDTLPADVRIAILDSCASGTLARQKGGVRRPAFMVDASSAVRGHAILTSSSETEVSQESDRIGGSYFTHNLVSGLRGAADVTGDGRVTLHEAYQFAFHETLARTENTRGGAQHPAYDMELAGTGDLVMTDLRSTAAVLVLGEPLDGRLYVRDAPGRLVVEVKKLAGRATELGLQPGRYTVMREATGGTSQAELVLAEGGRTVLAESAFRGVRGELTAMRGGGAVSPPLATEPTGARGHRFINVGLFPKAQTNDLLGGGGLVDNNLSFSLGVAHMARLRGVAMALGANWAADSVEGAQLAIGGNVARAGVVGMQGAVGGNWAADRVTGVQGAVGVNVARQGGLLGQLAVGGNLSGTSMDGTQLAVGANWVAGDFGGVQGALGLNLVQGRMSGVQLSSGVNWAYAARGAQLSLLNVGGDVSGMQFGVVNVAGKMNGLQLGLINVTNELESGLPVGLLSIVRNGQLHLELYGTDFNFANASIKVGSRYLYTTLTAGLGAYPVNREPRHWTLGMGLGAHVPLAERLFLDVDAVTNGVFSWNTPFVDNQLLHQLRLAVGVQLASRLALVGGPTLNLLHSPDGGPVTALSSFSRQSATDYLMWTGVQVGLRM
ncbi:MAG TPA: caspase family protein [Myxococcus sp.]|nr:caspase family protein [Myxococcus sp.]